MNGKKKKGKNLPLNGTVQFSTIKSNWTITYHSKESAFHSVGLSPLGHQMRFTQYSFFYASTSYQAYSETDFRSAFPPYIIQLRGLITRHRIIFFSILFAFGFKRIYKAFKNYKQFFRKKNRSFDLINTFFRPSLACVAAGRVTQNLDTVRTIYTGGVDGLRRRLGQVSFETFSTTNRL